MARGWTSHREGLVEVGLSNKSKKWLGRKDSNLGQRPPQASPKRRAAVGKSVDEPDVGPLFGRYSQRNYELHRR
jgi:hypothetical protein